MQAMAAVADLPRTGGHAGAANGAGAGVHDDFLDHMFGSLPPSAWHDLAAGTKPEDGAQADRMQQQLFGGGGMGRSPSIGGGGGDGGLLLPVTLGNCGSGGDVQALLKAAANSAVLILHVLFSN
ncbi:hypothetical protein ZWY2020_034553 [Hordeum vulgare]|nr:hypothetical protein ZWY2020_034553 [Hordeum vulgare]